MSNKIWDFMPVTDEKAIINSVIDGNHNAFSAIVDRYKNIIFNLAFRMTGSLPDAEDIAQETFLRAYRGLYRFDTRKPLFTWLYTICLNCIRNHRKKKGLHFKEKSFVADDPSYDTPQSALFRKIETENIQKALQMISSKYREAIVLRYYQDLSFGEIATLLGISASAAKMRVYRGLTQMKRFLA